VRLVKKPGVNAVVYVASAVDHVAFGILSVHDFGASGDCRELVWAEDTVLWLNTYPVAGRLALRKADQIDLGFARAT
jgi:hypothetical protein